MHKLTWINSLINSKGNKGAFIVSSNPLEGHNNSPKIDMEKSERGGETERERQADN